MPGSSLGQNIPQWIVEVKHVNASNKTYIEYNFTGGFPDIPYVTASSNAPALADCAIVKLTKDMVGITISGPIPGLKVEIHALGLKEPGNCYGMCTPTFESGDCTT
ncbi:MAG: hypothetical protein CME70_18650 [Halobacteriovorax sp.]|nr:hypothetical protein [Halobacteriovorax sp.]|tara:strand:+ start:3425 stop:3742 length:318 start_codon:yes stop_codon:yes gene_type:complete